MDVDFCMIQKDMNIRVSNILREFMEDYKIAPYMKDCHSGLVRHIVIKLGFTSGGANWSSDRQGITIPHYYLEIKWLDYPKD